MLKRLSISSLGAASLGLVLSTAALGETSDVEGVDTTVAAFEDICISNAESMSAARETATSSDWNFVSMGELPSYRKGPPMQTFASEEHGLEMLLRPEKGGFGCLILKQLPKADARVLYESVTGIGELQPKGKQKPGDDRYKWSLSAPKGSEVVLSIEKDDDPQTIILALESKGDPN